MKITLLTTLPSLIENRRIKEEVEARGDTFALVDMKEFSYKVINDTLSVPQMDVLLASDVVIVRGIFNAVKSIASLVAYLRAKGVRVFDNNLSSHPYSIDKVVDVFKLALAHIPTPNTVYARSFDEYPQLLEQVGYPAIIKSTRMGKGVGVNKYDTKEEAAQYINELKSNDANAKSYLIQSYIPYEHDLRVLVIGRTMYAMKRIPQSGEFRANFSLGGSVEPFPLTPEIEELSLRAITAVGLEIAGVDILIEPNGKKYILEVNHTPGFEGMEKALNSNIGSKFLEYVLDAAHI